LKSIKEQGTVYSWAAIDKAEGQLNTFIPISQFKYYLVSFVKDGSAF